VLADEIEHALTLSGLKNKKANTLFAFVVVVGADGLEPPTYAL
jgi:hypothetical protein